MNVGSFFVTKFVLCRDGDVNVLEYSQRSHSSTATSAAASSAYTLIETAHPVFGAVRKLWNSPTESHRVVGTLAVSDGISQFTWTLAL